MYVDLICIYLSTSINKKTNLQAASIVSLLWILFWIKLKVENTFFKTFYIYFNIFNRNGQFFCRKILVFITKYKFLPLNSSFYYFLDFIQTCMKFCLLLENSPNPRIFSDYFDLYSVMLCRWIIDVRLYFLKEILMWRHVCLLIHVVASTTCLVVEKNKRMIRKSVYKKIE